MSAPLLASRRARNFLGQGIASLPDGKSLAQQFTALLERIAQDASLDEDTRERAQDKTKAVAEGLAKVEEFTRHTPPRAA